MQLPGALRSPHNDHQGLGTQVRAASKWSARTAWMRVAPLLVVATLPVGGCDMRLPESRVYPTNPDLSAKLAWDYERSEKGDLAPVEDLVIGTGRVAQATRQMDFHFQVTTQGGAAIAEGDARVLIPPLRPLGFPSGALHGEYDPGYLPSWVAGSVMGMQVGGTRRISFNPPVPGARAQVLPAQRPGDRARSVSASAHAIVDGRSGQVVLRLPPDEPIYLVATLVDVCRPHFTVWQFPTLFDRNTERWLRVGSCT